MSFLSSSSSTSLLFPKTPIHHQHHQPSLSSNFTLHRSPTLLSISSRTFSSINNNNSNTSSSDDGEQDKSSSSSWMSRLEEGAEDFQKRGEKIAVGFGKGVEKVAEGVEKRGEKVAQRVENTAAIVAEEVDNTGGRVAEGVEKAAKKVAEGVEKTGEKIIDTIGASELLRREKIMELKRSLVDSVSGSDLGFQSSAEVRAQVSELVAQLEALNPTPNPTEVSGLLDGNWVLVYTAFSELSPLLAVGTTPPLKVQNISQAIDTGSGTVETLTTLSSPFATFSCSATASFEVRSPSRIQVQYKEAIFKPPEIKFDQPNGVNVFGQTISLSPVQQLLNPLQEVAASISRSLNGLPPLKIPIPGEWTKSWLLVTYLDDNFRISRGDGGLFVLIREGGPLGHILESIKKL